MEIKLVSEQDRIKMLPKYFGKQMTLFEGLVFDFADELIPEYNGGYWEMYEVPNGGFFMAPRMYSDLTKLIHMESPNGYSCDVSYTAAGIIVCIFALSHLSMHMYNSGIPNGHVVALCDKLKYLADESEYGREIFSMID